MSGRLFLSCALLLGTMHSSRARVPWQEFPIIEWQSRTPQQLATLRELGVTAGMVTGDRQGDGDGEREPIARLRAVGMAYYLENTATDFYAPYHRYYPGKPVNWLFTEAQAAYRRAPGNIDLLHREPSLSDEMWLKRIESRLSAMVERNAADHPLFYDLGDETGIADLSAFWDFDTAPASLAGLRTWLRTQYPSLAALNAEWGTQFPDWDSVEPELTRTAMRRIDGNFAAWSDFKAWMDEAFAQALRRGTEAVHAADPSALAGIEGAQMPGWGGYDYTRLAHAVDLMEIYDSGDNLPIVRSLNPDIVALRTAAGTSPADLHDVWRSILRGARGLIIWDDNDGLVREDASPGVRAEAFRGMFAALHGPVGKALLKAEPVFDPVAILYSPESFRLQWMLDHRTLGDAFMQRDADVENEDNAFRAALRGYVEALSQLHLRPRFVTPDDLATGRIDARALILPHTQALSPETVRGIETFAGSGGIVIADIQPGWFDGHGKRLSQPAPTRFHPVVPGDAAMLGGALGVTAQIGVDSPEPVEAHLYQAGNVRLVGLQTRQPASRPLPVTLILPNAAEVTNIGTGESTRPTRRLSIVLDPIEPTLLELRS